jgi:hypothetical protein
MGHLIDHSKSGAGNGFIRCLQRATALSVIGFAVLALWSSSAAAADTAPVNPTPLPPAVTTPAEDASAQVAAKAPSTPDVPDVPAVAAPTSVPAPPASVPSTVPAVPALAQTVAAPAVDQKTPALPKPPAISVSSVHSAVAGSVSGTAKAATPKTIADSLPDPTNAAPLRVDVPAVASVPNPPVSAEHPRDLGRSAWMPRALAPAITVTVHRIAKTFGNGDSISLFDQPVTGAAGPSASGSPAPQSMHGGGTPDLPGLPLPLQIPLAGSASGSGSSSTGLFLFGSAGLLVGLLGLTAPALSRRLQGSPASWRPAPYLSLLELPG